MSFPSRAVGSTQASGLRQRRALPLAVFLGAGLAASFATGVRAQVEAPAKKHRVPPWALDDDAPWIVVAGVPTRWSPPLNPPGGGGHGDSIVEAHWSLPVDGNWMD